MIKQYILQMRNTSLDTQIGHQLMSSQLWRDLYILGQSKFCELDQLSYIQTRLDDLRLIDMEVYDTLRVLSGDMPACQFEAGQQRGGGRD